MRHLRLSRSLLAVAALAITSGLVVLETVVLDQGEDPLALTGDPDEPYELTSYPEDKEYVPPHLELAPTKLPRPDESSSTDIATAVGRLSRQRGFKASLEATLAADVDTLLDLAVQGNFCDAPPRVVPPQCLNNKEHPGFYVQAAFVQPVLMPKDLLEEYLNAILSNQPVRLTFIAKDSNSQGKYYLVFRAARAVMLHGSSYDSVALVLDPDAPKPIRWFRFILPSNNGVQWLQFMAGADSAPRFELVAPASVKDWPGMWGDTGD